MCQIRHIFFLMFVSFVILPAASVGQTLERRHEALRDITTTRIIVGTFPNRDPTVPCFLDAAALERQAVETLRAAGLRTMTFAEWMAQSRRDGESLARDLEAQRRGERLSLDSEEMRRRAASIDFLKGLPWLQILLATTPVTTGGDQACALATTGSFAVFPTEDVVSEATGRRISSTGGLRVWEAPLRAHAGPEPALPTIALAQIDAITGDFLALWRRVNGR